MIRLNRTPTRPSKLESHAELETALLIDSFKKGGAIMVKDSVWGHTTVKDALREIQSDKCAYCEASLKRQFGDIEHFRPKNGYQTVWGGKLIKPGYFWLSYEWSNLLLSCEVCNRTHKGNAFPLAEESGRANSVDRDIGAEEPLLLNPYDDEPSLHFTFDKWDIAPVNGSEMAKCSIVGYGLDDLRLVESRKDYFTSIEQVVELAEKTCGNVDAATWIRVVEFLKESVSGGGQYTAMIREGFGDRIRIICS